MNVAIINSCLDRDFGAGGMLSRKQTFSVFATTRQSTSAARENGQGSCPHSLPGVLRRKSRGCGQYDPRCKRRDSNQASVCEFVTPP
jgi:hypothetical protein